MKRSLLSTPGTNDWISSLVVFVVALPLSLGIALASGAPPGTGIITAVIGGIVVGAFSGAPLVVSGPAAGLTAIVFEAIQKHGLQGIAIITVFAGIIQAALGFARLGRVIAMIPKVVLEGVLSAIGAIITIGQLHVMLGDQVPNSPVKGILTLPAAVWACVTAVSTLPILVCGVATIAVQLLWPRIFRRWAWVPPALPAVATGTALSLLWAMPRVKLAPLASEFARGAGYFFSFDWIHAPLASYGIAAVAIAVVASAETLLTARGIDVLAADQPGFHKADLNRELIAQGLGNTTSGIVGGLPITGVMVRSAVNVTAGAQSRWSTVLHGAWIGVCVSLIPGVLASIPLTALAAVLVVTGIKLLNLRMLIEALREHPIEGGIWLLTIAAIMSTDLLIGLGISLTVVAVQHYRDVFRWMKDHVPHH